MRSVPFALAVALTAAGAVAARAQAPSSPALSPVEMAVGCAPPLGTLAPPPHAIRVLGAQDTSARTLDDARDILVLNAGSSAGVRVGQRFYVREPPRRAMDPAWGRTGPSTAGWIRVVSVNEAIALASVEHACGAIVQGDYLEPYTAPAVPADLDAGPAGRPDFSSFGRVLTAAGDRRMAAPGDFVLIDRGTRQGVAAGMRFAVYRQIAPAPMPIALVGETVVVQAGGTTALTRIAQARDAVWAGDYVVPLK